MTEQTSEPETVAYLEEDKQGYFIPQVWMYTRNELTHPNLKKEYPDRIVESELIRRQDVIELLEERIEELNEMLEECDDREESKVIMLYLDEAENLKQKLKGEN